MTSENRSFAVVTGASSGIGRELAKLAAENNFDLLIAASGPEIEEAATFLRLTNAGVETVEADLATLEGVDKLVAAIRGRKVDALFANAGRGLGKAFLDQDWGDIKHVIDTNVTGTVYLLHKVVKDMKAQGQGRVLLTGSIAGLMPGTYQAVYNATKAFVDSFSVALQHELKDTGVTVTVLMPGPTDTEFFEKGDLMDTKVGQDKKADPAKVAKDGFEAMMAGKSEVVSGLKNKMQAAMAGVMSDDSLAEQHRKMAEPGSGKK